MLVAQFSSLSNVSTGYDVIMFDGNQYTTKGYTKESQSFGLLTEAAAYLGAYKVYQSRMTEVSSTEESIDF